MRVRTLAERPPVRIVHLGVGAFHRAHQAWYTQNAPDRSDWGIAGFTGRSPRMAELLSRQDGLYTLVTRSARSDRFQVITSLVEVNDAADTARLDELLATPCVAVVTLTLTEAGYATGTRSFLDADAPLTAMGRLVHALYGRHIAAPDAPIALVSCDNLPANGHVLRRAVLDEAERGPTPFVDWIRASVSFVSTSVDRITPQSTAGLSDDVFEATGDTDAAPVVAEPFSSWVLCGDFPAGRPRWEEAGAIFTNDIEQYERRKLWILNGAHTIMAIAGPPRGHTTVDEAISDPAVLGLVRAYWAETVHHIAADLDPDGYSEALLARFANIRIRHELVQIARDAETKLRLRLIPVAHAERRAGRSGDAVAAVLAAWVSGREGGDPASEITRLSRVLGSDPAFVARVQAHLDRIGKPARSPSHDTR